MDQPTSKPKMLLRCYRAIGDTIYTAPLFPFLTEKYDVYVDCSMKVYQLLQGDPRFKSIAVFAFEQFKPEEYEVEFKKRWELIREQVKPDVELDMNGTIEVTCIGEDFQKEFHYPVGLRRVVFGSTSFYESIFARCGLTIPNPFITEGLYFSETETAWAEGWRKRNEDQFIVMMPFTGSTYQKRFENCLEVTDQILAKYPDSVVYLAGDESAHEKVPSGNPRIRSICGARASIKQIVHMTKYSDCVVGPETFVVAAAGMWGTPKIMLATASSVHQLTQYQRNDFSFQAPIWCSPCHRAIYKPEACETMLRDKDGNVLYPACTTKFAVEPIMERVDKIYELYQAKRDLRFSIR
jgi:ADP-heptose:LPS heptosyltransferase